MALTLSVTCPPDPEGSLQRNALQLWSDTGAKVTISGRYISYIEISDWYERKFGKALINPSSEITIGPRYLDTPLRVRFRVLSPEDHFRKTFVIEVKGVEIGAKQHTYTNEHKPTPFSFRLTVRADGHVSVNVSMRKVVSTPTEALEGYALFEEAESGCKFRIEFLDPCPAGDNFRRIEVEIPPKSFPVLRSSFRDVLRKLQSIEEKTGVSFSLTGQGIGEEDWRRIHYVASVLETGRHQDTFEELSLHLEGPQEFEAGEPTISGLLASWQREEIISLDIEDLEHEIQILGVDVPLGPQRRHLNGYLMDKCATELQAIQETEAPSCELSIILCDGNNIEEFPDWLVDTPVLEPVDHDQKGQHL